jgi:hypothetical protein
MRVLKLHCSPYAVELVAKQMVGSSNYRVIEFGLQGVSPDSADIDTVAITLTQGDNIVKLAEDDFDLNAFCNALDKIEEIEESNPFRRAKLIEFMNYHNVGEDYRVISIQNWKFEVVHYI